MTMHLRGKFGSSFQGFTRDFCTPPFKHFALVYTQPLLVLAFSLGQGVLVQLTLFSNHFCNQMSDSHQEPWLNEPSGMFFYPDFY